MTDKRGIIDLHIHTNESDGTDTPDALIGKLKEAGIRYFSVTDHDTVDGAEYVEMHVPKDMVFIRGIEFSCITKAGKCHILAYDYDRNASAFRTILEEGYNRRRNILEKRISFLKKEFGIELTEDELLKLRSMNSVGKPHLGNLLVDKGLAPDMISAIRQYINPCKSDSDRLDAAKVISAVTESGGIPVWAHPLGGTGEKKLTRTEFENRFNILKAAGIKGLECYYSKYDRDEIDFLTGISTDNGMYISGGSDYHGNNKPVKLGALNSYGQPVDIEKITILSAIKTNTDW